MLFFFFLSNGWPNNAVNLDLVIAVKCGFEGKRGKKPKKAMKPRGRKGLGKALGRRNLETFAVCSNAQMTFSPAVSIISHFSFYRDYNQVELLGRVYCIRVKNSQIKCLLSFMAHCVKANCFV